MPRHAETRRLPYTPEQMFDLVADVGSYPQFLPWVIGARIRSKGERLLVADLVVGFKMLRETFTSRVTLDRPNRIHVDYLEGPLKYLRNDWRFEPASDGAVLLHFSVDFEFRSRLFETIAGAVFGDAVRRMVAAFETRAAQLYGAGSPGISSSSAQSTA
jgi:coenzyme Q-binding protein COQ10